MNQLSSSSHASPDVTLVTRPLTGASDVMHGLVRAKRKGDSEESWDILHFTINLLTKLQAPVLSVTNIPRSHKCLLTRTSQRFLGNIPTAF
jgi:hypothetical protein